MARRIRAVFAAAWLVAFLVSLRGPLAVVVGASFGEAERGITAFPPAKYTLAWYTKIDKAYWLALATSFGVAVASTLAAVALGIPAALGLVRSRFAAKPLVAAVFRAPVQIPAVVSGVAFLQFYYVVGEATGWPLVGSFVGLWLAHVFIATPYVVSSVGAVLHRFNVRLEEAALTLGASRWSTLRRVTLPVIMPGVYSGATYAFMVSFSDLPISLFLASEEVRTFPVVLFQAMDYDFNPSLLAVSTFIIAFAFVAMWCFQKLIGLDTLLRSSGSK